MIIYWVTNNLFTLGQQQWVLRKFPPPRTATSKPGTTSGRDGKQPAKAGGLFGRSKPAAAPPKPAAPNGRRPQAGCQAGQPEEGPPSQAAGLNIVRAAAGDGGGPLRDGAVAGRPVPQARTAARVAAYGRDCPADDVPVGTGDLPPAAGNQRTSGPAERVRR